MTATLTRPPTRPSRLPVAGAAAMVGALVVTAGADDGFVLCPFRRCTGGYCPGCGATRATNRLVRGDLAASWSHHPWVILAAVQAVLVGAVLARIDAPRRTAALRRAAVPLAIANTVMLLAIWIARASAGSIPTGWL